jgi:hypothetical protein
MSIQARPKRLCSAAIWMGKRIVAQAELRFWMSRCGDQALAVIVAWAGGRSRPRLRSSAARRRQFLDIAVAQGEAEIEPDRVLDDLGREAMAAVAEWAHTDILSDTPLASDAVSVTMPIRDLQK